MSAQQTHSAIGALVYVTAAIAWALIAFSVPPPLRRWAAIVAMFLVIVALVLWGLS